MLQAKKVSDVVVPFQIAAPGASTIDPKPGVDYFEVDVRHLTRTHLREIARGSTTKKLNPETRAFEEATDWPTYNRLYCDALVVGWRHMTPSILSRIVDLDDGCEMPPVNGDGGIVFHPDHAFFLWDQGDVASFQEPIEKARRQVLAAKQIEREAREGNSER